MKDWKRLIESLNKSNELLMNFNQHKDVFDEIEIRELDEGNYLFLLKGTTWVYEDLSVVNDNDPDYLAFLAYIDEFFSDDQEDAKMKENELKKWLSSVDNSKKKISSISLETNYKKIMANESINKAIPGGKYGCTLLIKNCGSQILKKLSIGRIYALIKHALNKQIINHLKTHIVKNDPKVNIQSQNRGQQIYELQMNILELLKEQEKEGVTLAQLPLLLQKKYHKFYNIQDLGFPKLKNFLITIEDKIELTRSSNNHIRVSLRKKKISGFPPLSSLNINIDSISQQNDPESQTTHFKLNYSNNFVNMNNSKKQSLKKPITPLSEEVNKSFDHYGFRPKGDLNMSASKFCEMFNSVKTFILDKLQKSRFGIEMNKLENELSEFLGSKFQPESFACSSFHQFLQMNFSDELEIGVKKTVKSKLKKISSNPDYLIYPRISAKNNKGSDGESSFGSFNQSVGSTKRGLLYPPNQLFSDSSYGNANKALLHFDSNSERSAHIPQSSHYRFTNNLKSNKEEENDKLMFGIFGYDDHGFPLYSQGNSPVDKNVNDTELTEEPDVYDKYAITEKKFVNYIYDD